MNRRPLTWLAGAVATVAVVVGPLSRRHRRLSSRKTAKRPSSRPKGAGEEVHDAPHAVGRSRFEGVWDYKTITPLERPQNMAGRATLTDEEVATLEARGGEEPRRAAGRDDAGRHWCTRRT